MIRRRTLDEIWKGCRRMISEQRNYAVLNTEQAKSITDQYLKKQQFDMHNVTFGLPEIFDRYHVWNVPV